MRFTVDGDAKVGDKVFVVLPRIWLGGNKYRPCWRREKDDTNCEVYHGTIFSVKFELNVDNTANPDAEIAVGLSDISNATASNPMLGTVETVTPDRCFSTLTAAEEEMKKRRAAAMQ